jgi:hypothetical protein
MYVIVDSLCIVGTWTVSPSARWKSSSEVASSSKFSSHAEATRTASWTTSTVSVPASIPDCGMSPPVLRSTQESRTSCISATLAVETAWAPSR